VAEQRSYSSTPKIMRVCDKHRTSHANQDKCEQEQTPKSHAWWFQSKGSSDLLMPPSRTPPHLFSSRTLLALQTTAYSRTPDKRSDLCKSNPLEGWWFALHSNKCLLSKCETRSKKEKTKHIIGSPRYGRESATLLKHERQVSNTVRGTKLQLAL
jgi:hypothetical protein